MAKAPEKRGRKSIQTILVITIIAVLLAAWLAYDQGLTNREAWQDQADKWWQSIIKRVEAVINADATKIQARVIDLTVPAPVTEADSEAISRLVAEPVPETALDPGPDPEPEAQPDLEQLPQPEREIASVAQLEAEQPGPDQLSLPPTTPAMPVEQPDNMASSVSLEIIFDVDSASLSPEAIDTLDEIANIFWDAGSGKIRITGYADGQGKQDYNMELSRRRADAAAKYIVASGIDAGFLLVQGLGVYSKSDNIPPENALINGTHGRIVRLEFLSAESAP